ncbi:MAG: site-specific integrase [Dehalococcoidia bacterium]|nr:site-specific integrase [Dehalococcoidia bacterium]
MASVYRQGGRPNWMVAWYDAGGARRVRSSGTTDKRAAERLAAKLEADGMLAREGIVDPRAEQFSTAARRPLAEHVADFLAYLRHKGDTEKHVRDREGQLTRLLVASRVSRTPELTPARVRAGIDALRTERQVALRTANRYLVAIKCLSRWLVREGRMDSDPLVGLTGFNPSVDRRHERRALAPDEVERLVAAAEAGAPHRGLSGRDRAMMYRIALGTGFRANEVASLVPTSFDLDAEPPTVTVEAGYAKNRREAVQPIRPDLAELLRPWLDAKPAGRPVLDVPSLTHRTAAMVRFDLAAAGIEYLDAAGRVADFHSLRVTYITNVVRAGANVKQLQALARHSTPVLSLAVYAKLSLDDVCRPLDAMPPTPGARPKARDEGAPAADVA